MDTDRTLSLIENEYCQQFANFRALLLEYNGRMNLTSITGEREMVVKHFLDSAVPEEFFPHGASVAEIGSGGGFPSIPLKIIREDLAFTLIESTGKKCTYLQAAVDNLGLHGVQVLNMRAEDAGRSVKHREMYDVCCARAVARMNTLCEYCLPLVKQGGCFIAYKGDKAETDAELAEAANAIRILGGEPEISESYELPDDMGKRTVIVIRKVKPTPPKYPRGNGKERKNPL